MDQLGDDRAVPPHLDPAAVATSTATEVRAGQSDRSVPEVAGVSDVPAVDTADGEASPRINGADPVRPLANSAGSRSKRALDLGLTVGVLPVALLLGLVIALLVVVTSRGPVFFVQERVGLGGRRFRMVKFRTMRVGAEERLRSDPVLWEQYVRNGYKLPAHMDTRVTAIGRVLRRSSLDELPQLVNILRGHMSLVGPRPVVPSELQMYGTHPEVYLGVKPGLTGWWQVNGRSGVGYPERVELDRHYAESWTFWLDIRILVRTPITLLRGGGAY
jgi:exopolysaccharide production protein ExoY